MRQSFGYRPDGRTTFSDNVTDLVLVDLHGHNLRCIVTHIFTRSSDHLVHFTQYVQPRLARLSKCLFHDFFGDSLDLDIHLQSGHAGIGTSHFEIHVSQVILIPQNICQNSKTVILFDQSHCNTCNRRLQRYTCIHQGERSTTDTGHRR